LCYFLSSSISNMSNAATHGTMIHTLVDLFMVSSLWLRRQKEGGD
jgi:hypothetical protein